MQETVLEPGVWERQELGPRRAESHGVGSSPHTGHTPVRMLSEHSTKSYRYLETQDSISKDKAKTFRTIEKYAHLCTHFLCMYLIYEAH